MNMQTFFVEQMATYASYHRALGTKLTHAVGVPAIAFSLLIPMTLVGFSDNPGYPVSLATVFFAIVAFYWILLDVRLGVITTILYLPFLYLSSIVVESGPRVTWTLFAMLFIGGWILQLIGHGVFEKRKPALLDNLIQILIAPVFLIAETVFALGLRKSLARSVEKRSNDRSPLPR